MVSVGDGSCGCFNIVSNCNPKEKQKQNANSPWESSGSPVLGSLLSLLPFPLAGAYPPSFSKVLSG